MKNLALEHARSFVAQAQSKAVKPPRKIEVTYIATEDLYVPSKEIDKMLGKTGTHLYYKPF